MSKRNKVIFNVVSVFLLVNSLAMFFFHYELNFLRFGQSCADVGEACSLWWKVSVTKKFDFNSVEFVPDYNFTAMFDFIKFDIPEFTYKFENLPAAMFDWYNFRMYSYWFLIESMTLFLYITIGFTVLTVVQTLLEVNLTSMSDSPSRDTFFLRLFKKIELPFARIFRVIYNYIFNFIHSRYWIWFILIWCFNLNLASIVVEFIAFIFFNAFSEAHPKE